MARLNTRELAERLGLSYAGVMNTLRKYEEETGKTLEFDTEGRTKFYTTETLKALRVFRKGITKGRKPGFSPAKKEKRDKPEPSEGDSLFGPLTPTELLQDLTRALREVASAVRGLYDQMGASSRDVQSAIRTIESAKSLLEPRPPVTSPEIMTEAAAKRRKKAA